MTETQSLQKSPDKLILITGITIAYLLPLILSIGTGTLNIVYLDKLFYSRFIFWITVLILLLYARQFENQTLLIWAESKQTIGFILLSVVVLYLLSLVASALGIVPRVFGWHDNNDVMKKIAQLLKGHQLLMIFISLTAGITEELIFRGYVLTRLSQLFKKPYMPVIISSLLFSALHYKYNSLHELIGTFFIGVFFSMYYIRYRNIKALMITHFMIDIIALNLAQHFKLK